MIEASEQTAEIRVSSATASTAETQGYWHQSLTRLLSNRLGMAMSLILLFFVLMALTAPLVSRLITHVDAEQQDLTNIFVAPTAQHLLGTDQLGRDTLTRLIYGAQVSLGVAALTMLIALAFGTIVGIVSGYYGGWIDEILMRLVDMLLAVPAIFFYIMMTILFRPNGIGLALIIASISWISVARLVRADVLSTKNLDFVVAARTIGARDVHVMARHLLPAVLPIIVVAASLAVGQIILIEAALDFLGLGIRPPTPSWGNMVTAAQIYLSKSVWAAFFPGVSIFLTVLATNIFGNAVRDAFDPRLL
jgi:peptide/nickel transport system permease protein